MTSFWDTINELFASIPISSSNEKYASANTGIH